MLDITIVQILLATVLKMVPGISDGARQFLDATVQQLPGLYAVGTDIAAFIEAQVAKVQAMVKEGRDPTQEEWDALNAAMDQELNQLQAQRKDIPDGSDGAE